MEVIESTNLTSLAIQILLIKRPSETVKASHTILG